MVSRSSQRRQEPSANSPGGLSGASDISAGFPALAQVFLGDVGGASQGGAGGAIDGGYTGDVPAGGGAVEGNKWLRGLQRGLGGFEGAGSLLEGSGGGWLYGQPNPIAHGLLSALGSIGAGVNARVGKRKAAYEQMQADLIDRAIEGQLALEKQNSDYQFPQMQLDKIRNAGRGVGDWNQISEDNYQKMQELKNWYDSAQGWF